MNARSRAVLEAAKASQEIFEAESLLGVELRNHHRQGTLITLELGAKLGLSLKDLKKLGLGCRLHDIGKGDIPREIRDAPRPLTDEEFDVMKTHTLCGKRKLMYVPGFDLAADIALSHHEWWNGEGYPYRLHGELIPFYGRLMALGDVLDALISERVYKAPVPLFAAINKMREGEGTQFEPYLMKKFLEIDWRCVFDEYDIKVL